MIGRSRFHIGGEAEAALGNVHRSYSTVRTYEPKGGRSEALILVASLKALIADSQTTIERVERQLDAETVSS